MKKQISNWGNYPVIESDEISFVFEDQIQKLIPEKQNIIARGNGRCYGDASLGKTTINTLKYKYSSYVCLVSPSFQSFIILKAELSWNLLLLGCSPFKMPTITLTTQRRIISVVSSTMK